MIDGVINCPKSPTTEPRCHSDQVDPLVQKNSENGQNYPKKIWVFFK